MKKLPIIISILVILFLIGGILYFSKNKSIDIINLPSREVSLEIAPLITQNASSTYAEMYLSYPKSDLTHLSEIFNFVQNTKNEFWSKYGNLTAEDAKDLYIRGENQYQMYVSTTIATSTKTVSYLIYIYEYTGGAHGNTSITSFTYDARGKLIPIDSVFTSNYLEVLAPMANQFFNDTLGEYTQSDAINSGTEATINNYSVWYLTPDAVTFVFGQYQIGPYVLGIQEYPIDKSKIQDILKPAFK